MNTSGGLPSKKYTGKDVNVPPFSLQLEQDELAKLDQAQREINEQIIALRQRKEALDSEKARAS